MRKFLISFLILISLAQAGFCAEKFLDNPVIVSKDAIWMDSRAYATLAEMLTAIGSDDRTIKVVGTVTVSVHTTIASNVTLDFERDGCFSIAAGKTMTLQTKRIRADQREIFKGAGEYVFASGSRLMASWFSTLAVAVDKIDSDLVTLIVNDTETVGANLAFNKNTSLEVWQGGLFNPGAGISVTFNSKQLNAGNYQIFGNTGSVVLSNGTEIKSSWFSSTNVALGMISGEGKFIFEDDFVMGSNVTFASGLGIETLPGVMITLGAYDLDLTLCSHVEFVSGAINCNSTGRVIGLKYAEPEWWGVDGTADDVEIGYAIAALVDGVVQLDATTYTLANSVVITNSNVTIRGKGYGTLVIAKTDFVTVTGSQKSLFAAGDDYSETPAIVTGVVFENFRIDGNKANQSSYTLAGSRTNQHSHCILLNYAKKSAVRNMWLHSPAGDGVCVEKDSEDIEIHDNQIYATRRCAIAVIGGKRITVNNNVADTNEIVSMIDIEPDSDDVISDIIVSNNILYNAGETGLQCHLDLITTATKIGPIKIFNNTVRTTGTYGMYCSQLQQSTAIENNSFWDVGTVGIQVANDSIGGFLSNNIFEAAAGGTYGMSLRGANLKVSGGKILNFTNTGLYSSADATLLDVENVEILGNVKGIEVLSPSISIKGCKIYNSTNISASLYGDTDFIGNHIFSDYAGNAITTLNSTGTKYFNFLGNTIESTAVNTNVGIKVNYVSTGQIKNNTIKNFTNGVSFTSLVTDGVDVLSNYFSGNTLDVSNGSRCVGTLNLSVYGVSNLYSAAGAVTATLPDGLEPGQIKIVKMSEASNPSTLSVTHHETTDPEVFTFGAVTDILILMWNGLEWVTVSNVGVAI